MQFAHFEFDPETDRLGEGPLSEVYKALDINLGRTVALKILRSHAEIDPQADLRFRREAQRTSSLNHPNITTIYEYDEYQGTSFIAMEFLAGLSLKAMCKRAWTGNKEDLSTTVAARVERTIEARKSAAETRATPHPRKKTRSRSGSVCTNSRSRSARPAA